MKSDRDLLRYSRPSPLPAEMTIDLLNRARLGDEAAFNQLLERCIPALQRWASGRLPSAARSTLDTTELVQDAITATLSRLDDFQPHHQGGLQACLRQAVLDRIRDLMHQDEPLSHQPVIPADLVGSGISPLEQVIGLASIARYEAAIEHLGPEDRAAIVGRIELQQGYDELAIVLDKPSASAARLAVTGAIKRLAEEMRHAG